MCDFCENLREKTLLDYDNRDSMRISYGQYSGVNVYADLHMKGNMLILRAGGSYRSQSDCYYDAEGLDIDNENAHRSNASYMQIKYCPFCGNKIKSVLFEKEKTKDDISELKRKLEKLKNDLDYSNIFIEFSWKLKERTSEEIEEMVKEEKMKSVVNGFKFYEVGFRESIKYYEYQDYYKNPLTIKEIKEQFGNLKCSIKYGLNDREDRYYELPDKFTLNTKVKSGSFFRPTYYGGTYILTDSMYEKLIELGYIERNDKKYDSLKKKQEKIKKEIKKIEDKVKELNEYYNSLAA